MNERLIHYRSLIEAVLSHLQIMVDSLDAEDAAKMLAFSTEVCEDDDAGVGANFLRRLISDGFHPANPCDVFVLLQICARLDRANGGPCDVTKIIPVDEAPNEKHQTN